MKALLLAGIGALALSAPATAQTMDHSNMPGMKMPASKPTAKPATRRVAPKPRTTKASARAIPAKRPRVPAADPHAGHDMSGMQGMEMDASNAPAQDSHAGHDISSMPPGQAMPSDMATMPDMPQVPVGTDLAPGNAPAPAPQPGLAASRYWGAEPMGRADRQLRKEHGGMTYYQVLFNLAEYQARPGRDGYRWDGEASIGGDINRFWLKSEG